MSDKVDHRVTSGIRQRKSRHITKIAWVPMAFSKVRLREFPPQPGSGLRGGRLHHQRARKNFDSVPAILVRGRGLCGLGTRVVVWVAVLLEIWELLRWDVVTETPGLRRGAVWGKGTLRADATTTACLRGKSPKQHQGSHKSSDGGNGECVVVYCSS